MATTHSSSPSSKSHDSIPNYLNPLLPHRTPYDRFTVYETISKFYIVGANRAKEYRLLKIDRTLANRLSVSDDNTIYTHEQIQTILNMIHEANVQYGGVTKLAEAFGILGFIRFLEGYYMILLTKRTRVGQIGKHVIYSVAGTTFVTIPHPSRFLDYHSSAISDEIRFKTMFSEMDLTTGFFFSYTYDLTHSLQFNLTSHHGMTYDAANMGFFSHLLSWKPTSQRFDSSSSSRFIWNHFLLTDFVKQLKTANWIIPLIHGWVVGQEFENLGRSLDLLLIARRSRFYAGRRFYRRGLDDSGSTANDVEIEQILFTSDAGFSNIQASSFVQIRGSIPLYWSQQIDANKHMPKPGVTIPRIDPFYVSTRIHFEDLMGRYGYPIICLNLVKSREKTARETLLSKMFIEAIHQLNSSLPEKLRIQYIAWDFSREFKKVKGDESIVDDSEEPYHPIMDEFVRPYNENSLSLGKGLVKSLNEDETENVNLSKSPNTTLPFRDTNNAHTIIQNDIQSNPSNISSGASGQNDKPKADTAGPSSLILDSASTDSLSSERSSHSSNTILEQNKNKHQNQNPDLNSLGSSFEIEKASNIRKKTNLLGPQKAKSSLNNIYQYPQSPGEKSDAFLNTSPSDSTGPVRVGYTGYPLPSVSNGSGSNDYKGSHTLTYNSQPNAYDLVSTNSMASKSTGFPRPKNMSDFGKFRVHEYFDWKNSPFAASWIQEILHVVNHTLHYPTFKAKKVVESALPVYSKWRFEDFVSLSIPRLLTQNTFYDSSIVYLGGTPTIPLNKITTSLHHTHTHHHPLLSNDITPSLNTNLTARTYAQLSAFPASRETTQSISKSSLTSGKLPKPKPSESTPMPTSSKEIPKPLAWLTLFGELAISQVGFFLFKPAASTHSSILPGPRRDYPTTHPNNPDSRNASNIPMTSKSKLKNVHHIGGPCHPDHTFPNKKGSHYNIQPLINQRVPSWLPPTPIADIPYKAYSIQYGALRTNCLDSLDRTNFSQFITGKVALEHALHSMGMLPGCPGKYPISKQNQKEAGTNNTDDDSNLNPTMITSDERNWRWWWSTPWLPVDSPIASLLMKMYEELGNTLALQYGGSHAMKNSAVTMIDAGSKVPTVGSEHDMTNLTEATQKQDVNPDSLSRKYNIWKTMISQRSQNMVTAIQRYISNNFTDAEMQDAINLFLGNYIPSQRIFNFGTMKLDSQLLEILQPSFRVDALPQVPAVIRFPLYEPWWWHRALLYRIWYLYRDISNSILIGPPITKKPNTEQDGTVHASILNSLYPTNRLDSFDITRERPSSIRLQTQLVPVNLLPFPSLWDKSRHVSILLSKQQSPHNSLDFWKAPRFIHHTPKLLSEEFHLSNWVSSSPTSTLIPTFSCIIITSFSLSLRHLKRLRIYSLSFEPLLPFEQTFDPINFYLRPLPTKITGILSENEDKGGIDANENKGKGGIALHDAISMSPEGYKSPTSTTIFYNKDPQSDTNLSTKSTKQKSKSGNDESKTQVLKKMGEKTRTLFKIRSKRRLLNFSDNSLSSAGSSGSATSVSSTGTVSPHSNVQTTQSPQIKSSSAGSTSLLSSISSNTKSSSQLVLQTLQKSLLDPSMSLFNINTRKSPKKDPHDSLNPQYLREYQSYQDQDRAEYEPDPISFRLLSTIIHLLFPSIRPTPAKTSSPFVRKLNIISPKTTKSYSVHNKGQISSHTPSKYIKRDDLIQSLMKGISSPISLIPPEIYPQSLQLLQKQYSFDIQSVLEPSLVDDTQISSNNSSFLTVSDDWKLFVAYLFQPQFVSMFYISSLFSYYYPILTAQTPIQIHNPSDPSSSIDILDLAIGGDDQGSLSNSYQKTAGPSDGYLSIYFPEFKPQALISSTKLENILDSHGFNPILNTYTSFPSTLISTIPHHIQHHKDVLNDIEGPDEHKISNDQHFESLPISSDNQQIGEIGQVPSGKLVFQTITPTALTNSSTLFTEQNKTNQNSISKPKATNLSKHSNSDQMKNTTYPSTKPKIASLPRSTSGRILNPFPQVPSTPRNPTTIRTVNTHSSTFEPSQTFTCVRHLNSLKCSYSKWLHILPKKFQKLSMKHLSHISSWVEFVSNRPLLLPFPTSKVSLGSLPKNTVSPRISRANSQGASKSNSSAVSYGNNFTPWIPKFIYSDPNHKDIFEASATLLPLEGKILSGHSVSHKTLSICNITSRGHKNDTVNPTSDSPGATSPSNHLDTLDTLFFSSSSFSMKRHVFTPKPRTDYLNNVSLSQTWSPATYSSGSVFGVYDLEVATKPLDSGIYFKYLESYHKILDHPLDWWEDGLGKTSLTPERIQMLFSAKDVPKMKSKTFNFDNSQNSMISSYFGGDFEQIQKVLHTPSVFFTQN